MSDGKVDETLEARGERYGEFTGHAEIAQALKATMRATTNWAALSTDKKEALEMVVHKIARILNGDPEYPDSWLDIGGYARLVHKKLVGSATPDQETQALPRTGRQFLEPFPDASAKGTSHGPTFPGQENHDPYGYNDLVIRK
jgi:hypothetical protein